MTFYLSCRISDPWCSKNALTAAHRRSYHCRRGRVDSNTDPKSSVSMFPDFPRAKERLQRLLIIWIQRQVPRAEPLIADVRSFRQHEGKAALLKRADASSDGIDYK